MMKSNLLAASVCVLTLSLLPGCLGGEKKQEETTVEVTTTAPASEEMTSAAEETREMAPVEEEAK